MAHADGSVGTAVPAEPDAGRPALTLPVMIDACCAGGVFALPVSGVPGPRPQFPGLTYYILPAITPAAVSTAYTARAMRSAFAGERQGSCKRRVLYACAMRLSRGHLRVAFCYRG